MEEAQRGKSGLAWYANGGELPALKISWAPLFSARGRRRAEGGGRAPRASLYLKGLTANAPVALASRYRLLHDMNLASSTSPVLTISHLCLSALPRARKNCAYRCSERARCIGETARCTQKGPQSRGWAGGPGWRAPLPSAARYVGGTTAFAWTQPFGTQPFGERGFSCLAPRAVGLRSPFFGYA